MTDINSPTESATDGTESEIERARVELHNGPILAILAEACRISGRMYGSQSPQYEAVAAVYDDACARAKHRRVDER